MSSTHDINSKFSRLGLTKRNPDRVRGARLMRLPDATYRESSPDKAGENPLSIRMRS